LANLVDNAVDACKRSKKDECTVCLRVSEEGETITFEVSDTGCGMESDVKDKVFTNFFTTKGLEGTGLGLLVTRKIVEEHGGRICVETEPGKGSTFRMEFPRTKLPEVA
jgi:signal transduction histidine kinase